MSELDGLKLLRRIEEGVAGKSGEAFFRQIVKDIAGALNAYAAFTSRLLPERRAVMLAFWVRDRYERCLEYSLAGTPCEFVYDGRITGYAREIGKVFPVDREWFESLGVNSYLGIPIQGETGEVCGHLAVMDTRERDWHDADVDVLKLFSLRTAVELERDRAHRALTEANELLRLEIERRTAIERQLEAAKRSAEQANQAKSVFISQMSHELRTPLNGILGYAQLLRRRQTALSPEQSEGLEVIERSGEHLLNLVNDLLDLAKIEAGRLELRREPFDLREVLQDAANLTRVRADKAGLSFSLDAPPDLPLHAVGDARALRQILLNLLGNAVKFTPSGGSVALRATHVCADGRIRLQLQVIDTGVGMCADDLARIFEPFYRGQRTETEGAGLGLTITQRLVRAMGGDIEVRSEVSVGTQFDVRLELPLADPLSERRRRSARLLGYDGPRQRVLVADDDLANRSLLTQLLSELGFDVDLAADGEQALAQLLAQTYALVLTDLRMPRLDGLAFVRRARAHEPPCTAAFFMMSASADDDSASMAKEAGCSAFLLKPLRLEQVLEAIERALPLAWRHSSALAGDSSLDMLSIAGFELDATLAARLQHLAMQGDVEALLTEAAGLAHRSPAAQGFCAELRALASQYDTQGIRRLIAERTCGRVGVDR